MEWKSGLQIHQEAEIFPMGSSEKNMHHQEVLILHQDIAIVVLIAE